MQNPFKKPYPFNDNLKHNAIVVFFISVGVPLFLFLLQPFGFSLLARQDKYYLIIGFGVITFLALSLHLLFIPAFFPKLSIPPGGMSGKKYSGISGYYFQSLQVTSFIVKYLMCLNSISTWSSN
jgi:hypothetical protein